VKLGTPCVLACVFAVVFSAKAQAALTVWQATPGHKGSTLLSVSSAGRGALIVLDGLGQTQVCKPDLWTWSALARLDQPGFLVGLSSTETQGPRVQQWDAQGRVEWEHTASGTFAPLADGGMVTFSAADSRTDLIRFDPRGQEQWRTEIDVADPDWGIYPSKQGSLLISDQGRIYWTLQPDGLFFPRSVGRASLGLIDAQGNTLWSYREAMIKRSLVELNLDRAGSVWWFQTATYEPSANGYTPRLSHWTASGTPVEGLTGRSTVGNYHLWSPRLNAAGFWLVAEKTDSRRYELVLRQRDGFVRRFGPEAATYPSLVVDEDSAFVAARLRESGRWQLARYDRAGLVWMRWLNAEDQAWLLMGDDQELRLLSRSLDGSRWLSLLDKQFGHQLNRYSLDQIYQACTATAAVELR
jgi:hypothetical protein